MYLLSSGAAAMAMARMSARPASTTAMLGRRASPSATARLRLCRPLRRQFAAEAAASAEPEPEPAGVSDLKQRKGLPAELLGDAQWPSKQVVGWARKWRSKGNPAVLVLNVKGDLVDVRKPDPLAKLRGQSEPPPGLLALIGALQKAAADDQVATVYLRIGGLATSMARVEELRDAIRRVRAVKPVVGFFESGAELEIALGASCTELHVSPGGYTMLSGFAQRSVLLRGLLKRFGLEPEVSQIGAWKGGHVLSGDPTDGVGEPEEVKIQSAKMLEAQRERYLAGAAPSCPRRQSLPTPLLGALPFVLSVRMVAAAQAWPQTPNLMRLSAC